MDKVMIQHLKQPCKHRGIKFKDNRDGSITLDGKHFEILNCAEDYIDSKIRMDLPKSIANSNPLSKCDVIIDWDVIFTNLIY